MATMIFFYNPKPGVSIEEFKQFLDSVDTPACLSQPSAISTRILRILDDNSPYAMVEILEVSNFEEWDQDSKSQIIKDVMSQWPSFGDINTLKAYKCVDYPTGAPDPRIAVTG
jgi:hypothetical protein